VRESYFDYLNSHVAVSRETYHQLEIYYDLLLKWQPKINLVGPDTISHAWQRHFLDSLQLLNCMPSPAGVIVDFGSGAGFPGLVLAIAGAGEVHLIESDFRKTTFLKEVARLTGCPVVIHNERIEQCHFGKADVITSRACSSLTELLNHSTHFVSHETTCLFHKGKNYITELEDAKKHWLFDMEVIASVTDTQGVILKITNVRKRGL
jgi:16S rRNA (guanine527-N7)-methyltransferase